MIKLRWFGVGAVAVVFAGLTLFYTRGGYQSPSAEQPAALAVQDERLSLGDPDAPLKIVEYVDMLCPYCAKVHEEVMPRIVEDYVDRGKAHYEMRLVAMIEPSSQKAAEGAYCAAEQNEFWQYMDTAYRTTWREYYSKDKSSSDVTIFEGAALTQFAERVGVDVPRWSDCVDTGRYAETLAANKREMDKMKAYGTPHFLFNGQSYSGAPPYAVFKTALDTELAKVEGAQ